MRWGRWWAIQWGWGRLLELGVHVEPRRCRNNAGLSFGPYIDLHLPGVTVSIGNRPIYAGELDLLRSTSRGGLR